MKIALLLLSVVGLGCAAPSANFQDYFEEFLAISEALEGAHFGRQTGTYMNFAEYRAGVNAIDAAINFEELFNSLKVLPEYKALEEFLKELTIDVDYYVKRYEAFVTRVNNINPDKSRNGHSRQRRHDITGTTLDTSIVDTVSMLPRRQLRQLFHQKMAHDEFFRNIIEAIRSDKFKQLYNALWANRTFVSIANALENNALSLKYLFEELIPAFFGQNTPLYVSFQMQFDEFLDIIMALEGKHFMRQLLSYAEFPEFLEGLNYVNSISLISFYSEIINTKADIRVIDLYLRQNDLFIAYYIDRFQLLVKYLAEDVLADQMKALSHNSFNKQTRQPISGKTLQSWLEDTVRMLPRKQLVQLFDYKYANNEVFKNTVEALRSEEWQADYKYLWADERFIEVVTTLKEHGLDVGYLFDTFGPALFGLSTPTYFTFQNQFDDFVDIIVQNVGDEFVSLVESYMNFPEFRKSLEFLDQTDILGAYQTFAQNLPAFATVDSYLKEKDIYITYYMDRLKLVAGYTNSNVTFDGFGDVAYTNSRIVTASGNTMRSFLEDAAALFPKTQLDALYQDKLAENQEFITAIEGLRADEWTELYETLWRDEQFNEYAAQFSDNDFDLRYVIEEFVPTLWGQ